VPSLPRLLFFDLDGTLLAPGSILTRRTVAAVSEARRLGCEVALATGGFTARTQMVARALAGQGTPFVWSLTHNGAALWDPSWRLLRCQPTPRPAIQAALATAGHRVWVTYEAVGAAGHTGVYYAGRLRREMTPFVWGPQRPSGDRLGESEFHVGLEPRWDWRRARNAAVIDDVLGCWCIGSPAGLAPLDAQASSERLRGARYLHWGLRLSQVFGRPRLQIVGRDIGAAGASKGAAAAWLSAQLGISPSRTAAFGDGDNDLELFDFAGTAVAMAGGTARARAAATAIAPPSAEDGVAQVLERWLGA
jgi:hypothetical protein